MVPKVQLAAVHHPARPALHAMFGSALCRTRFPRRFALRFAIKFAVEGRLYRSSSALLYGLGSQCGSQLG